MGATMLFGQLLHDFSIKKLAMQWLPLLIFAPGLIQRTQHRTYTWLCFVVLIYFTAFVVEVGSPLRQWTDIIAASTAVLFVSAMLTSRYTQHWLFEANNPAADHSSGEKVTDRSIAGKRAKNLIRLRKI